MFEIYSDKDRFYQWDLNQKLIVKDNTITEVHFCNKTGDCALVCQVYKDGSLNVVDVPNILFQDRWDIKVYGVSADHTKYEKRFKVCGRSKPADYIYTETECKTFELLEKRMDELESTVSVEGIEKAVEDYLIANPVQGGATQEQAAQIEENKANINKLDKEIDNKLNSAQLPNAINTALAQAKASGEFKGEPGADGEPGPEGKQGPKGDKGDTGNPGKDGTNGTNGKDGVSVTHKWSGTTLSITSASGTSSANLKGEKGDTGATGPQGIQGPTGDKGDTGPAGKDGTNGKDGVSCTHKWSGTTLSITSASGTSTANLKGEKGDTGPQGEKGDKGDTGENGVSCSHSWNGTTLSITSSSGTSSANLKGATGDKGDKGDKGDTGTNGQRGNSILKVTTAPTSYTTAIGGKNPIKKMSLSTIKSEANVNDVLVGDQISHSYYLYRIYYIDASNAYMDVSQSIRGSAGKTPVKGTDYYTEADKTEMVNLVKADLPTLTFTGIGVDGVSHSWTIYGV